MASSTLVSSTNDPDSSSIRPRNRRLISVESTNAASSPEPSIRGTARLAPGTSTPLRDASPLPTSRLDVAPPERGQRRDSSRRKKSPAGGGGGRGGGFGFGLLDGSWATGWGTVQDIATGWLSGASTENNRNSPARAGSRSASHGRELGRKASSRPWAQETAAAANVRPTIQDIGAGILAEREAALVAARTASVLESHDGVNGGLDVAGRFKRRTSDDIARRSADGAGDAEEILAYIHHVKPTDTYVGVILKYGCREEPFKKLNGLWSRDSLLTRKWVAIPVDACEAKGKPCAGPSAPDEKVDLLAPTPEAEIDDYGWRGRASSSATQQHADDIFGPSANGSSHKPPDSEEGEKAGDSHQPWSHVRWVSLDSFPEPVEIGRVSRKAFGYFPPRRKRSLLNASSTFSTPRQSFDVQSSILGSGDGGPDRGGPSSRRQSTLSNRPNISGSIAGTDMSTPTSARSRVGSVGADTRPMWMRRPGGVGSLNQKVRTPGPDKDPLNTWAKKHFPSLILDNLPSMSVLGAETAHFGFPGDIGVIAESAPAETGRDAAALARQGTGFDRAAAAVETWLRGAFAKRPGTPMMGGQGQWGGDEDVSDLIELTDTQSEDDRRTPTATEPGHAARLPTLPRTGRDGSRGRPDAGLSTSAGGAKLRASGRVASSASLGGKSMGKNKDD